MRSVIEAYDSLRAEGSIERDAKVIVRCATEHSVRAVHAAFQSQLAGRPEGYLAIHDQFAGSGGTLLGSVPDIRARDETFLIHQFKLMEGIDDPRCQILALFENFANERQLVQQVGRVIRHPAPRTGPTKPAIVLADRIDRVETMWAHYRDFDEACVNAGGRPPIRNSDAIAAQILAALPEVDDIGRRFRRRADPNSESIDEDISSLRAASSIGRARPSI